MSINLLQGLLGGGNQAATQTAASSNMASMATTPQVIFVNGCGMTGMTGMTGTQSADLNALIASLISGMSGSTGTANSMAMGSNMQGVSATQESASMGGVSAQASSGGLLGGLLGGSGGGLLGGLMGGSAGSTQASGGMLGGGFGGLLGGLAQSAHHAAESAIDAAGLQPFFGPIDEAIIHPILWDPLSMLTGVDVSAHPEGVAQATNPLGIKRD